MPSDSLDVHGRRLAVDNLDKVLFPDVGYTKGDLVDHYTRVAGVALPYLRDRPVAVRRFPDGLTGTGFFQKNAGQHLPDWVRRTRIEKLEGGTLQHLVVDEPATLAFLADQAAIELHPWLARADDLEPPDQLTTAHRIEDRGRRVFVDHLRNAYGQTAVAPTPSEPNPVLPSQRPSAGMNSPRSSRSPTRSPISSGASARPTTPCSNTGTAPNASTTSTRGCVA